MNFNHFQWKEVESYAMEMLVVFLLISTISFILAYRFPIPSINTLKLHNCNEWKLFAKSHSVTIKHEGIEKVLSVREDVSILEAALDAGIELPYDCKLGVCLTCPSRVLSGTVDQSTGTLEESVIAKGFALTCCTFPRSDCVITSIDEDELVSAQFQRS